MLPPSVLHSPANSTPRSGAWMSASRSYADDENRHGCRGFRRPASDSRGRTHDQRRIGHDHVRADGREQCSPHKRQRWKSLHQPGEPVRREHDERDARGEAGDEQQGVTLGRLGDCQRIVCRHADIIARPASRRRRDPLPVCGRQSSARPDRAGRLLMAPASGPSPFADVPSQTRAVCTPPGARILELPARIGRLPIGCEKGLVDVILTTSPTW